MKMNNVKYGDITVAWHKTTQNLKNGNLLDEVLTLKLGIYETAKFLQINAINWNGDEIQLRGVGYIVYPYGRGETRNYHRGETTDLEVVYNFETGEAFREKFEESKFILPVEITKEEFNSKDFPPFLRENFSQMQ